MNYNDCPRFASVGIVDSRSVQLKTSALPAWQTDILLRRLLAGKSAIDKSLKVSISNSFLDAPALRLGRVYLQQLCNGPVDAENMFIGIHRHNAFDHAGQNRL